MPNLPAGDYKFYAGIDPGQTGGIGIMNAAGTTVRAWDMPLTKADKDRQKEIDLDALYSIYREFKRRPKLALGIEWPTTRPGEGAERSERFGRGKGYLHAFAHLLGLDYYLIAPNLWKGRLGLPGKSDTDAVRKTAELLERYYPDQCGDLIRGPRGGLKGGRIDALAIAHFLRTRSLNGMQTVVDQFGKDSPEAMAFVLGAGRKRKKSR